MGPEPMTTEFLSEAPTDGGIRPCIQLALRANLVQPLEINLFVQCSHFISAIALVCGKVCFKGNLAQVFTLVPE